jgi:DNA polymerase elongation subunit (family B)
MGIVLKRRDNANICKEIFGGAIREIMVNQDLEKSLQMVKSCLRKLLDGEYPYDMFVISKTLRSYYKAPDTVAHNVLARRIARRDPGNKPQTNDRVPYIYVQVPGDDGKKKILQGDRVENPDYAHVMKLKIDYKFYLERQVMQPILQVFKLDPMYYERCKRLFDDTLMEYDLKRTKSRKITEFFKVVPKKQKDTRKHTIIIKRDTLKEGDEVDDVEEVDDDTWGDGIEDNDLVDMASYEF